MAHHRNDIQVWLFAYQLRHNQTDAENRLWSKLRNHQLMNVHFRRQHPIGNFIVDFCATQKKLIIELDGGQHLEQKQYDRERTEFLVAKGYRVLRFWNNDVMSNLDDVLSAITEALN